MNLQELLKAKDDSYAERVEAKKVLAEAKAALEAAQAELRTAEETFAGAQDAEIAAHQAIHDFLEEVGHHYTIADDGTVTIYHAINERPGWCTYQPIPGALIKTKGKAV